MKPLLARMQEDKLLVCAHRGASNSAPENTISALQKALDAGAEMIELDVQITKDHELVVFHDDTLERTTNGKGLIREHTYEELSHLDAGSWFTAKYANERIPRFRDAIELLQGKTYLNIEIKPQQASEESARDIASIIGIINHYGMIPYTAFSSFDHSALVFVKSLGFEVHTIALNVPGDNRMPSRVIKTCGADAYGCSLEELNASRSENCIHNQIPLGVYTVNTPEELEYALNYSVSAVVSNVPEVVVKHYDVISTTQ